MDAKKALRLRVNVVYALLVVFALAIVFHLFTIQLVEGKKWRAEAGKIATALRTVQPDRGHIYSEDGRLLATSVPQYDVRMDMRADGLTDELFQGHIDSLSWCLSQLFVDRSAAEYRRDLVAARGRHERYFLVKRNVDHEQLKVLRAFPLYRLGRSKAGLVIEKRTIRMHPFNRLASRTVGYVLKDSTAIGLEGGFDKWLKGVTGHRLERRLSGGAWMPVDDEGAQDPVPGSDIHSTIDINLQDLADHALEAQLRKNGAHHGCVVVMETATGHVKAISNLTLQADSSYAEDLNYAVGTSTEPGSTFKTASLMVALDDGRLKATDRWDTKGGRVRFYNREMKDSHDGGFGVIDLHRALEVSSNTAISQAIVKAYGKDPGRFVDGLRRLGLDRPLGVRIPGEAMPIVHGPEDKKMWSGVSLPWMSIGYEVSMTPLQILAFYNGIANNGRVMQPQFVSRITRAGKEVERFEPVVLNEKMCSDATLKEIRSMLEGVVDTGTATNLREAHFRIAGKTGTAQVAQDGSYKEKGLKYQASFVGYFPAEAPKYSCIVVVSSPSMGVYYGNRVAGPIFTEIANKIYSNRLELQTGLAQVQPPVERTPLTYGGNAQDLRTALSGLGLRTVSEGEGEWVSTTAADSAVLLTPRAIPGDLQGMVPNVVGMGLKDALFILENKGLRVQVVGAGMVKRQSLRPGERYQKGHTIIIELTT
ncbi:MAG: transpeptidase family protein [Flavobacteriales bacterium]|nr:transpeptidase family protein [Flavobacteriales bacterium]MBL0036977.1 transpeptidase family protein [Flavobacteriales bacterium]